MDLKDGLTLPWNDKPVSYVMALGMMGYDRVWNCAGSKMWSMQIQIIRFRIMRGSWIGLPFVIFDFLLHSIQWFWGLYPCSSRPAWNWYVPIAGVMTQNDTGTLKVADHDHSNEANWWDGDVLVSPKNFKCTFLSYSWSCWMFCWHVYVFVIPILR